MSKIVVVTGASAGVGRATVEEFAKQGYDVALLARDPDRLERPRPTCGPLRRARARRSRPMSPTPMRSRPRPTRSRSELGPIDVWVNVAMATVFAPVSKLTAQEVERGTRSPISARCTA